MNIAIGIGILLLGDWVLPGAEPSPAPPTFNQRPAARPDAPRTATEAPPSSRTGSPMGGDRPVTTTDDYVPLPPTDPNLSAPDSPWNPPTGGGAAGTAPPGFGTRRPTAGTPSLRQPRAPTGTQRTARTGGGNPSRPQFRPNIDLVEQQSNANRVESLQRQQPVGGRVAKPFAGYSPSSAVSPYMNLFRRDTGSVDNYNTLVRPQMEQQQASGVFGGQIRGLQSAARLQGSALQRLGKHTQGLEGTMVPEYYQNYRGYFPMLAN